MFEDPNFAPPYPHPVSIKLMLHLCSRQGIPPYCIVVQKQMHILNSAFPLIYCKNAEIVQFEPLFLRPVGSLSPKGGLPKRSKSDDRCFGDQEKP